MLVVDSSSNSVDVEHAEKRVAVDERHRHRARRRLDRPSSRIDDAGDEHRLARLGDSARNTLPETDPRPGCSAGAPNADGPQLSTAVHEHDRAVARLEKLVRALQNGLEHLLEVEDEAPLVTVEAQKRGALAVARGPNTVDDRRATAAVELREQPVVEVAVEQLRQPAELQFLFDGVRAEKHHDAKEPALRRKWGEPARRSIVPPERERDQCHDHRQEHR